MSEAPAKTDTVTPTPPLAAATDGAGNANPNPTAVADQKPSDNATLKTDATPAANPQDAPKPPEKYEFKPRKDSPLQKSDLEEIEANAKAKGLSQEDAQKLVETREADFDKYNERQTAQFQTVQAAWKSQVESDPEIAGSDGKAFKENVELAHRALERFADPEFKKEVNRFYGNHPGLVKTFLRIGRAMAEDKAVLDGRTGGSNSKVSREQKLFPSHFKEKG